MTSKYNSASPHMIEVLSFTRKMYVPGTHKRENSMSTKTTKREMK